MSPEFQIDSSHLLLIGAGSGVGAAVVRRFGRESFRTLVARGEKLQPVAAALRQEGIVVDTLVADASDLDTYRSSTSSAASSPHRSLRRDARCPRRTILFTGGGFADYPVPALASLSLGKAALRSAATLIAGEVASDGVQAASITIAGQVAPGTAFDLAPRLAPPDRTKATRIVTWLPALFLRPKFPASGGAMRCRCQSRRGSQLLRSGTPSATSERRRRTVCGSTLRPATTGQVQRNRHGRSPGMLINTRLTDAVLSADSESLERGGRH
ncbi:MAG: hypothetical protein WBP81_21495 [Solirubrobacteraceae bacterium]